MRSNLRERLEMDEDLWPSDAAWVSRTQAAHDVGVNFANRGINPGTRVTVLPGRNFQGFGAGDSGSVVRVNREMGTCDVAFDGRGGVPLAVAIRHLGPEARARDALRPPVRSHSPASTQLHTPCAAQNLVSPRAAWDAVADAVSPGLGSPSKPSLHRSVISPRAAELDNFWDRWREEKEVSVGRPILNDDLRRGLADLRLAAAREASGPALVGNTAERGADVLADAVQASAYATASAATSGIVELQIALADLRDLLRQEAAERLSGMKRLERGVEHLRLEADQLRQMCKQTDAVDGREHWREQFRNLDDQLAGKDAKWDQRFGEMSARMEEIARVQARIARDEIAARPEAGRLDEVAIRLDALQSELNSKATQHSMKDFVNREISVRIDGIEREISTKATHQLVKEIVEDSKQMLSNSIQDVLLQWEHRFNDLTTRIEGLASRRAQMETMAEEAVAQAARMGEKDAAKRQESEERARDAESTLRKLLSDLNGIRQLTETPPTIASQLPGVSRYTAAPPLDGRWP